MDSIFKNLILTGFTGSLGFFSGIRKKPRKHHPPNDGKEISLIVVAAGFIPAQDLTPPNKAAATGPRTGGDKPHKR